MSSWLDASRSRTAALGRRRDAPFLAPEHLEDRPEPKRRDASSSRLRRASRYTAATHLTAVHPPALYRLSRSTTSRRTSPRSSRRSSTRNITPPGTASSGVTLGRTSRTRRSTSSTSTSGKLPCFCSSPDERGTAARDDAHGEGDVDARTHTVFAMCVIRTNDRYTRVDADARRARKKRRRNVSRFRVPRSRRRHNTNLRLLCLVPSVSPLRTYSYSPCSLSNVPFCTDISLSVKRGPSS